MCYGLQIKEYVSYLIYSLFIYLHVNNGLTVVNEVLDCFVTCVMRHVLVKPVEERS